MLPVLIGVLFAVDEPRQQPRRRERSAQTLRRIPFAAMTYRVASKYRKLDSTAAMARFAVSRWRFTSDSRVSSPCFSGAVGESVMGSRWRDLVFHRRFALSGVTRGNQAETASGHFTRRSSSPLLWIGRGSFPAKASKRASRAIRLAVSSERVPGFPRLSLPCGPRLPIRNITT